MNISGRLKYNSEHIKCHLTISNGKIYEITIDEIGTYDLILTTKEHSSDYVLEKIINIKNSKFNSNYLLKYFGGELKPSLIYLKLNWFDKRKLDFAMKQTLIQSKDIKIELLKYFLTFSLSFTGGIFYERNQIEKATPETTPKNEPKAEIKKDLDTKILKIETKKDTIIVKNIKNASNLNGAETKPK